MKTTIKKDEKNAALICDVLELSDIDYKSIRLQAMHNYATNYSAQFGKEIEMDFLTALINSDTFEKWFQNQFNRKNWMFVHRYCLRTYTRRKKLNRAVRGEREQLIEAYRKQVQIKPEQLYPDHELMRIILKENQNH